MTIGCPLPPCDLSSFSHLASRKNEPHSLHSPLLTSRDQPITNVGTKTDNTGKNVTVGGGCPHSRPNPPTETKEVRNKNRVLGNELLLKCNWNAVPIQFKCCPKSIQILPKIFRGFTQVSVKLHKLCEELVEQRCKIRQGARISSMSSLTRLVTWGETVEEPLNILGSIWVEWPPKIFLAAATPCMHTQPPPKQRSVGLLMGGHP